ncbi:MAG: aminoacyl-tRNA hydrolase, partial [Bacteroidetes bacterium]|nr:aminoacyl-tRNA hydrolase [Bacteroidota bacterium]
MRTILGIGNIGLRYQRNRHNAGFLVLDYFAQTRS